jgi:tellurite methyltransferase
VEPTPYLKKNVKLFPERGKVLDIGCGNGRNSKYMIELGYDVIAVDMAPPDFGVKLVLGEDPLPSGEYDIILANYVLMFLTQIERKLVIEDIKSRSKEGTILMIEMYPAKDGYKYIFEDIVNEFEDWEAVRKSKDRCVLVKGVHSETGHKGRN